MMTLWQDIRYGIRMLGRNRGFTVVAVLTLAVGIGASTAMFSVVNAVLLRPLPYSESERLVEVNGPLSIPNFIDWQEQQSVFERLCLYREVNFNVVADQGAPARVTGVELSSSSFAALRLKPLVGRFYSADEDRTGGPHVTVLSEPYWRSRFGSDAGVLDKTLSIDGTAYTVIGVMPGAFELVANTSLVIPVEPAIKDSDRTNRKNQASYQEFARLKSGVSIERAKAVMEGIHKRLRELYPDSNKDWAMSVRPLIDARVGGVRPALWILLGAVLLVLFIACANVANLLLVRATARRRELSVRSALGAEHERIIRQLLTESMLLAALGAALGLLLARGGTAFISVLAQNNLPRAAEIGIDWRVLLFTTAMALGTGVLFGLVPAWQASRPNLSGVLKDAGRGSSAGRTPLLHGLTVGQVALSLVLLFGAGLLLRSFQQLTRVDLGFNLEHVLSFRLDLPEERYSSLSSMDRFTQDLLGRLRALPGVRDVSLATEIPIGGRSWVTDLSIEGRPETEASSPLMELNLVGSDYFRVMGIPVLKGRSFVESDSRPVVNGSREEPPAWVGMRTLIIDEEFARRLFPNEDPIGKQIRLPWGEWDHNPVMTVVGVVGRVKQKSLREDNSKVLPMGYLSYRERPNRHIAVIAKTTAPPETLAHAAREQLVALDPTLPIYQVRTLTQMRDTNIARDRLNMILSGTAALIALTLAVVGIYGVMAFWVAQRRREIGIRMALGARRGDVLLQIMRQGLKLTILGVAVGFAGALALTRVLAHLLFGVAPRDPLTFAAMAVLLVAVTLIACWLPARRAARIDPMTALRYE